MAESLAFFDRPKEPRVGFELSVPAKSRTVGRHHHRPTACSSAFRGIPEDREGRPVGGRHLNGVAPTTISLAADRQCLALPRTSHKPEQAHPAPPPCFRSRSSGAPRQRRHAIPKAAPAAAARPQWRLSAPPHLTRPDQLPALIRQAADRARLQTYAPPWFRYSGCLPRSI